MGFFDKLKSAANFITGGGAVVNVATEDQISDGREPVKIFVQVQTKDGDIDIRNCYVKVRAIETVWARDIDAYQEVDGSYVRIEEEVTNSVTTYETELIAAGAQTLDANETFEFEVALEIPADIAGTYRGENAEHVWQIYAGLDVPGNDPDSNWVTIEISK